MFVKTHTGEMGHRNAAFVCLHAAVTPFSTGGFVPQGYSRASVVSRIVLVSRFDGMFGFPGGMADQGEDMREAAAREAFEEIGVTVLPCDMTPLCTHRGEALNTHLFMAEIGGQEMLTIHSSAVKGHDFIGECCGVVTPNVTPETAPNILNWPFAGSGDLEISEVVEAVLSK